MEGFYPDVIPEEKKPFAHPDPGFDYDQDDDYEDDD